jgi:hypothetical protein
MVVLAIVILGVVAVIDDSINNAFESINFYFYFIFAIILLYNNVKCSRIITVNIFSNNIYQ